MNIGFVNWLSKGASSWKDRSLMFLGETTVVRLDVCISSTTVDVVMQGHGVTFEH